MSAQAIAVDHTPLRTGCRPDDATVQTLPQGAPVTIRFAMAGEAKPCFKVDVQVGGQPVSGYVLAEALTDASQFDATRRDAATLATASAALPPPLVLRTANASLQAALDHFQTQPAAALQALETALTQEPRNAQLLALAGQAAYLSEQLDRAIAYLEQAQALDPRPETARMLADFRKEHMADKGKSSLFGTRFQLRFDGGQVEPAVARQMVATLEQEYSRVSQQLGCQLEDRLMTIVQAPESYAQGANTAGSDGIYDGRIRIALMEGNRVGPQTRRVFAHELTHACLTTLGNFPSWLHEGLAQQIAGDQLSPGEEARLQEARRAGQLPKLASVPRRWSQISGPALGTLYRYALAATGSISTRARAIGFTNLLRNPALLEQAVAEFDKSWQ